MARISEGECSATKNEIGSINAACAGPSAPLTVVDGEGGATRRERRDWAGKSVCTRTRGRRREHMIAACKTSATERQQTHACATWSERSGNNSLNEKE